MQNNLVAHSYTITVYIISLFLKMMNPSLKSVVSYIQHTYNLANLFINTVFYVNICKREQSHLETKKGCVFCFIQYLIHFNVNFKSNLIPPKNLVFADVLWFNFSPCCTVVLQVLVSSTLLCHCWAWLQVQQSKMVKHTFNLKILLFSLVLNYSLN